MSILRIFAITIALLTCFSIGSYACEIPDIEQDPLIVVGEALVPSRNASADAKQVILYDPKTMVMYLYIVVNGSTPAITPLYNADGTLRLFNPNEYK